MNDDSKRTSAFLRGLAAAVVEPGIRSLLLVNPPAAQFDAAATFITRFLETFSTATTRQVSLGAYHHNEQLWGSDLGSPDEEAISGLLVQRSTQPGFSLVLVRDLSTLSLEASRACVQLLDAPVAHYERYGRKRVWAPRLIWLAACSDDSLGQVSEHLLDRFALQLAPIGGPLGDRKVKLTAELAGAAQRTQGDAVSVDALASKLDAQVRGLCERGKKGWEWPAPRFSNAVWEALESFAPDEGHGLRRPLALARLATGLARLDNVELDVKHVREAASVLGLRARAKEPDAPSTRASSSLKVESSLPPIAELKERVSRQLAAFGSDTCLEEIAGLESSQALPPSEMIQALPAIDRSAAAPVTPAPASHQNETAGDKHASMAREHAVLQSSRYRRSSYGAPIGVRHTDRIDEIAIVPTLVGAAPFQRFRRDAEADAGWIIYKEDWLAYRRATLVETMLIVVLDLTCCADRLDELVPYLRQAYIARSCVRLVLVGCSGPRELRAEVVSARNVLAPELRAALDEAAGRATPLAHGLSLAARLAREHCSRGRGSGQKAEIVVMSDGLGNVPLRASRDGCLHGRVGREGVDDALRMAGQLREIRAARIVAIPPERLRSEGVFASLVDALGAEVQRSAQPRVQ